MSRRLWPAEKDATRVSLWDTLPRVHVEDEGDGLDVARGVFWALAIEALILSVLVVLYFLAAGFR